MEALSIWRNRQAYIVLLLFTLLFSLLSSPRIAHAASVTIPTGVQLFDSSDDLIQAHGAGMIKVGSYYYMYGENRNPDWTFKAVSMYRSTDLKNWEFVNDVLTSSSDSDLNVSNIERPKIIYNSSTGKYVLWAHKENGVDYGDAEVMVASSSTVDGNYTYHGSFRPLGYDSRDMTVYNDNGTAYLISATSVNADMNIYKLSSDFLSVDSLVTTLWAGSYREAPAMFKRGSVYFLVTSGATGWDPNQAKYATATDIEGTWSGLSNFGNGTTYDSQSTYVIPIEGSSTTSYLYMGDRWAGAWGGPVNDSRYIWLPLSFPSSTSLSMSYYDKVSIDTSTGVVTGSNHAFASGADYELTNRNSGKSLAVGGTDKSASGASIVQETDSGQDYQRWSLVNKGNGYYSIINADSGKYMDISGESTADEAHDIQWTSTGGQNQEWNMIDNGNGYFSIENRNSRKMLEIESASTSSDAIVVQSSPDWSYNQEFQITTDQTVQTNVALNKAVTYSSQQSGNEASHIVDGSTSTRWSAQNYPQWVRIDLGQTYAIDKTELVPYMDRAYQYKIEVSTNGSSYTTIVDRTSNTTGGSLLSDSFAAVNARYVRLTVTGAYNYTGGWASALEFRVFEE
ncbi:RICIN domain-containing protein [Paenibacillus sp. HB172176]|uniref:RICIN domain-containing protein n=1 Tax=Paenibacillus sp. HB172176 TaxID=2493690 RepID=UPI00143AE9B1|nr:RICIN domain-containing protein [Paenibacillus sp. HB172176]